VRAAEGSKRSRGELRGRFTCKFCCLCWRGAESARKLGQALGSAGNRGNHAAGFTILLDPEPKQALSPAWLCTRRVDNEAALAMIRHHYPELSMSRSEGTLRAAQV